MDRFAIFRFHMGTPFSSSMHPFFKNVVVQLILGLKGQDDIGTSGANQPTNTIQFQNGPDISLPRERGHLWTKWNNNMESLFIDRELEKLH